MTTLTTGPGDDRGATGAFTLLELIAVLVLISTVLAVAAPSLRGFARGRQTTDAAARVLALTHLARSRAASWGSVHRLNFDAETRECWLTMQKLGAFEEIEGNQGQRFRLPAGVSVTLELQADGDGASEQAEHVQFYPGGRCDAATIELTGGLQDVVYVSCPSASERFRITTVREGGL